MFISASLQHPYQGKAFRVPGPRPVRDSTWPRGRPDLTPVETKAVSDANVLADYAIQAMALAEAKGKFCLLEFPEDLGRTPRGTPASIWQDPSLKQLAGTSLVRGAIYQDEWAPLPF